MTVRIRKVGLIMLVVCMACRPGQRLGNSHAHEELVDRVGMVAAADRLLTQIPVPITNFKCDRSAGGKHDFYSEGDYWWPNPDDPDGPYIRRDGQTNPGNFTAHREAMRNLSSWVATLTAAFKITGDKKYARKALEHLNAWFINPSTQMNPSLLYAQAIKGKVTGRGIGIIDTIHLIEVAQSILVLENLGFLKGQTLQELKGWFGKYVTWLTTHPYGLDEKDHGNNHSTWWAAQVAAFAKLAERPDILLDCRSQFKKLLTAQMDEMGGFPDELERTKPYNYSLFNVEGYAVIAKIASTPEDNLWHYQSKNGSIQRAIDFLLPAIKDKRVWTYAPDVQHFDELPIQSATLLFAAEAYGHSEYRRVWEQLNPERKSKEVDRNFPLRQPVLWL